MEKLWMPGRIGPMTVKNRTVRSATNEHLATRSGELPPAWREIYTELAEGGVGLIITGQFCVDAAQRADEGQPLLAEGMDARMLARSGEIMGRTCEDVHRYGAKLVVQLSHTGAKAPERLNGCPGKGPADFDWQEMENLVKAFTFAAKTCQDWGADGVQIHLAHGYLLSDFLNPEVNTRTDEYGGSLENRFRMSGEIIRAVREVCGREFAILVKVDCTICGDLHGLLALCRDSGVDCAEISSIDLVARKREEEPIYLSAAVAARTGIDLPICLVGGVNSLDGMRRVMDAGIEFVSLSRPLIREPDLIGRMERGEVEQGTCIGCSGCFKVYRQRPVRCVFHKKPIPQLEQVFGPYETTKNNFGKPLAIPGEMCYID